MEEPRTPVVGVSASTEPDPAVLREWDTLVDHTPGSDVAQLSSWASIRQESGFDPLYVFAHEEDRLVGGALVLERPLPMIGRVGYVSNGPVVSPAAPREPVVDRLSAAMERLARGRLRALFVQPPADARDVSVALRRRGFRQSESGIAPAASIRVDLRRDIEDLRKGLTKANRRRTRHWAERGVRVRMGSRDDIPVVADLVGRSAEHQQFEPLSSGYIQNLHRELDAEQHAAVFVAEIDGSPAAALLCTRCGGVVKQRLSGMERSERARKDGVSAAAVWRAMEWAKANGYHTYDFGGISVRAADALLGGEPDSSAPLKGTERFKTSFGGEVFRYPEQVELLSSPTLRLAYDISRRTRAGGRLVEIAKRTLRRGRRR
jgi:lipid II:glycine glycyltransferase (peptidoglycan interpeptide bridge formation enzyme)